MDILDIMYLYTYSIIGLLLVATYGSYEMGYRSNCNKRFIYASIFIGGLVIVILIKIWS